MRNVKRPQHPDNNDLVAYHFFSNTAPHCNLIVNGQTIKKVNSCKYLGIIIDDELKWNLHIENIYKKIMKYTSILNSTQLNATRRWIKGKEAR